MQAAIDAKTVTAELLHTNRIEQGEYYTKLAKERTKIIAEISGDDNQINNAIANVQANSHLIYDALTPQEKEAIMVQTRLENLQAQNEGGKLQSKGDSGLESIIHYKNIQLQISSEPALLQNSIDNLDANKAELAKQVIKHKGTGGRG
jgi:hypothetical protein